METLENKMAIYVNEEWKSGKGENPARERIQEPFA